jgi:SAM-dependent methyltransferase
MTVVTESAAPLARGPAGDSHLFSSQSYDRAFYEQMRKEARRSANGTVPAVLELLRPRSVIDVGCGTGVWLSTFVKHGVTDVLGVDGEWVDRGLEIADKQFIRANLTEPFVLDRRFDLVVSLEVAEHLPPECAEVFVRSLVGLGPVVLFSAAIPHQGGAAHLNEQWPEYWAAIFARYGYVAIDCVRPRIWNNRSVDYYYAQNILVYADSTYVETHEALRQAAQATAPDRLALVHPRAYLVAIYEGNRAYFNPDPERMSFSIVLSVLPRVTLNALIRTLHRWPVSSAIQKWQRKAFRRKRTAVESGEGFPEQPASMRE